MHSEIYVRIWWAFHYFCKYFLGLWIYWIIANGAFMRLASMLFLFLTIMFKDERAKDLCLYDNALKIWHRNNVWKCDKNSSSLFRSSHKGCLIFVVFFKAIMCLMEQEMHTHTRRCTSITHTYEQGYNYACIHRCIHRCIHTYTNMHSCTHSHTCTHTCTHKHTHTYIHMHTHAHANTHKLL